MDDAATVTTYGGPTRSAAPVAVLARPDPGEILEPGTIVGRYVVTAHVGAGGMGRVYAAHDPELDRKVALKLLRSERDDDEGRTRLLGEARALARLAHPHVVTVHDVGIVDEQVFVAMELVSGATMRKVLARGQPGWKPLLELLLPVAQGLAAVHAAGLVHRDLKPENVMVGDDGRVRVMDFGLARAPRHGGADEAVTGRIVAEPEGEALTRAGTRLGTPPYMAPEQWLGRPADARTDQFAFCVMAWEGLYGERPFVAGSLVELERAITGGVITPPKRARDVPRWLRRVLERGLSVDPERRHASMDALVGAIARGRKWGRIRWAGLAGIVLAAAVGGTTLASTASDGRPEVTPSTACAGDDVCVMTKAVGPVCMEPDGTIEGAPCEPGVASDECPAGHACAPVAVATGVRGRCAPVCTPKDDRPQCVSGCYNQYCSGPFAMCTRDHGACQPVSCTHDADCQGLVACDYPERRGPGFRCNTSAGYCERARPTSAAEPATP